jgi:hypothetical protein
MVGGTSTKILEEEVWEWMTLGGCRYLIFVGSQKAVIGMGDQNHGLSMHCTMTSTLGPGSVTAHVLRNDVLQQHIDVSREKWRYAMPLRGLVPLWSRELMARRGQARFRVSFDAIDSWRKLGM